jgi:hypothetical protein
MLNKYLIHNNVFGTMMDDISNYIKYSAEISNQTVMDLERIWVRYLFYLAMFNPYLVEQTSALGKV